MAARRARSRFASPFVVTIAAIPACHAQSQPSGPHSPPAMIASENTTADSTPPGSFVAPNTRPGTVLDHDRRWIVTRGNDSVCRSSSDLECTEERGGCNALPSREYTRCPDALTEEHRFAILQPANQTLCVTYDMPSAPSLGFVNPPPPVYVDCPQD
jgi:hypothetical protein